MFDRPTAFSFYFLTFMKNNLLIVRKIYFEFVLEVSILCSAEPKGVGFRKYLWLYVHTQALASKLHTEQMWTKYTTNMHLVYKGTNEKNTYSSICLIFFQNHDANGFDKMLCIKNRHWWGVGGGGGQLQFWYAPHSPTVFPSQSCFYMKTCKVIVLVNLVRILRIKTQNVYLSIVMKLKIEGKILLTEYYSYFH